MACRNCREYDHDNFTCMFNGDGEYLDPGGREGCPNYEPIYEDEEKEGGDSDGSAGCIVMFLLLPYLLLMKII